MSKSVIVFTSESSEFKPQYQCKLDKVCSAFGVEQASVALPCTEPYVFPCTGAVHIASSCPDLKLLLRGISTLIKNSKCSQYYLLEDLVVVERAYIYTSRERQFFREFSRLSSLRSDLELSIISSNDLRNKYGEDDTYCCPLPELEGSNNDYHYWKEVKDEVQFHEMMNQGNAVPRLVSIQSIADPVMGRPLYRHPNDEEPPNVEMIPIVREILEIVENHTGIAGINHALIQWYRNGRDNIAAHSDKTLDIDLNTPIINVSLGVNRVMTIQNKQDKQFLEKIPLRNGECVVFGLDTNKLWHHEVAKDMVLPVHPIFDQERISFTFRRIATYINSEGIIVGQGSPYKTVDDIERRKEDPEVVAMQQNQTRVDLIHAFSSENRQSSEFDWNVAYGRGFLVR